MKTFAKGSTTFICSCCGHNTRFTGAQSVGSKMCPICWDLAGMENQIQDGQFFDTDAEEAAACFRTIQARSTIEFEKAQKSHDLVWNHPLTFAALGNIAKKAMNNRLAKEPKVATVTTEKYTYPANLTKEQKKAFRAKARRSKK